MSKGARHRAERARRAARKQVRRKARKQTGPARERHVRLFHGTAGATGDHLKAHGMRAAGPAGLLVFDGADMARPHAAAATARLLADGAEDGRGLIVEVSLAPERFRADEEVPGAFWVKEGVRPGEIVELHYFAPLELADDDVFEEMAGVFDTEGQDWRRAATGEMEP